MSERRYRVEFTGRARKQLEKLDHTAQERLLKAAALLAREPRPPSARRLRLRSGADELWRVRVGDYRLIYVVDDEAIVVVVARFGHRSVVYRRPEEL